MNIEGLLQEGIQFCLNLSYGCATGFCVSQKQIGMSATWLEEISSTQF